MSHVHGSIRNKGRIFPTGFMKEYTTVLLSSVLRTLHIYISSSVDALFLFHFYVAHAFTLFMNVSAVDVKAQNTLHRMERRA